MGGSATTNGGRAPRAFRLLFLLVLAMAGFVSLLGCILDASTLKMYLYSPLDKDTQSISSDPNKQSLNDLNVIVTSTYNSSINSTQSPLLIARLMDGIKYYLTNEDINESDTVLPLCDDMPPDLGSLLVNKTEIERDFIEKEYPAIQLGGRYTPPNCTARHKVAIIVPYRDRHEHLVIFLNHMHPFLMQQQIDYGIFIIEQEGKKDFNRATLMNVGFKETQKIEPDGWQCFIFHDIDLLPVDTRNLYSCPEQPRHMSVAIDKFDFQLPYKKIFGGVSAMTKEQFTKVNGFSNKYWGWGGEDDDMYNRITSNHYSISRYNISIARYIMLEHEKATPNPKRFNILKQTRNKYLSDGLSTLKYKLINIERRQLYTHILANIDAQS